MKKQGKKGFTIVELVIVIAVIAILAAVLIPTFSSLIQRARLSADTQAVREMNVALANDEKLHGKPQDIEQAMQVLANAGYNSKNWVCLTEGYQVYWDKEENQCVLYNASTARIEFPEGYDDDAMIQAGAADRFLIYNNNMESAIDADLSLGSGNFYSGGLDLSSNYENKENLGLIVDSLIGSDANPELKSALGIDDDAQDVKIYASNTTVSDTYSSGTYAKVTAAAVGTGDFTSSSESAKPNLYSIEVVVKNGATPQAIEAAQKAAGEYVYSIFVQMNTTTNQEKNTSIVIAEDTTLDLSSHEWKAVNSFSGYFGTSNAEKPVIIDGMRLTDATGYAQTKAMQGSNSKYFMTGFIGTLYGSATVENLVFKNFSINSPGRDYTVAAGQNSRNTVAVIGGILPNENNRGEAVEVIVRNIKVENVQIGGEASVGGIVGYIGAEQGPEVNPYPYLNGSVLIENCSIEGGSIASKDAVYVNSYSPVGGIVGFTVRTAPETQITIKNCSVSAEISGYGYMGGILGNPQCGTINIENCDVSGATFKKAGYASDGTDKAVIAKIIGSLNSSVILNIDQDTIDTCGDDDDTVLIGNKAVTYGIAIGENEHLYGLGNDKYNDLTFTVGDAKTPRNYATIVAGLSALDLDDAKTYSALYWTENSSGKLVYTRATSVVIGKQESAVAEYLKLDNKLIDLKYVKEAPVKNGNVIKQVSDQGKATQRNWYYIDLVDAAKDTNDNKYKVRVYVQRSAEPKNGVYTYTYYMSIISGFLNGSQTDAEKADLVANEFETISYQVQKTYTNTVTE